MTMKICSTELAIDIETYSSVSIDDGVYAYTQAPDFEILLLGYKFSDEDKVKLIDLATAREEAYNEEHYRFWQSLNNEEILKTAYNANFERTCLTVFFKKDMPPEQWRDTMILAASLGLPRSLADVGNALNLKEDEKKLKTGKALIQYFCKPCKPTKANGGRTRNLPMHAPEKWELFKEYNKGDVVSEQAILNRLKAFRPDKSEQDLWTLDQHINDGGVKIDMELARNIIAYNETHTAKLIHRAEALTGLSNPNSLTQLKAWLADNGVPVDSLTKTDVEELLAGDLPANVREVLTIRKSLGKTSVKKYETAIAMACDDNRARGLMQFYGGHTGRWAGRGLQPQNLVRNNMPDAELDLARELVKSNDMDSLNMLFNDVSDVFSQLVRTVFIPSTYNRFIVSDFSAIEARVLAWIAGEDWRLDVFKNGGDIYCESASRIYHVPVEKHGQNAELRQRGKVAELALGYGGNIGAMKSMDTTGSVPEEEMSEIVQQWRRESPRVVEMWKSCEKAAKMVISDEAPRAKCKKLQGVTFYKKYAGDTPILFIKLPSGRPIALWDPDLIDGEYGSRITYMTQDQTTRKWVRVDTYGGKLTENIVQSVARDCLAEKMKQLDAQGYRIAFHVHDEIVADVPAIDKEAPKRIDAIMSEPIEWAPGLPLKGSTYECDFYRKD